MLYESVMVCTIYASTGLGWSTGARFLTDPVNYRARKAIFISSLSKSGEMYTPEENICSY